MKGQQNEEVITIEHRDLELQDGTVFFHDELGAYMFSPHDKTSILKYAPQHCVISLDTLIDEQPLCPQFIE